MSLSIPEGAQSGSTGTESHTVILYVGVTAGNKTAKVVVTSCDMMFVLGFMKICKFDRRMLCFTQIY
jgi:hypothetical protein